MPLETFPAGYHCSPGTPLPFINLASQKNFIALYHMGIYANDELLNWFVEEYGLNIQNENWIWENRVYVSRNLMKFLLI